MATRIETTGGQRVIRELSDIDRVGRRTAQSFGGMTSSTRTLTASTGRLSAVLSDVARDFAVTGNIGTRELKQLVGAGASLLTMFGGPLTAAVGVVGVLFATQFGRAREEMEKTSQKAVHEIARLQNAGDIAGIMEAARKLETGEPSAGLSERAVGAFKGSLRDLRAELALLEKAAETNPLFGLDPDATKRLRELRSAVPRVTAEIESLRQAALNIAEPAPTRGLGTITVTADAASVGVARLQDEIDVLARKLTGLADLKPRLADTFDFPQELLDIEGRGITIRVSVKPVMPEGVDVGGLEFLDAIQKDIERQLQMMPLDIGSGIFEALGTSWGQGMEAGGDVLLGALGGIFSQMGKSLLAAGLAMEGLLPALSNPFTSGPAMIAAGALLTAVGAALSSAMMGRGGGSTSTTPIGRGPGIQSQFTVGQPSAATSGMARDAATLTPVRPIVNNFAVIGERDQRAQRQIVNLIDNAAFRGARPRK